VESCSVVRVPGIARLRRAPSCPSGQRWRRSPSGNQPPRCGPAEDENTRGGSQGLYCQNVSLGSSIIEYGLVMVELIKYGDLVMVLFGYGIEYGLVIV